jgi:hypothetical protein
MKRAYLPLKVLIKPVPENIRVIHGCRQPQTMSQAVIARIESAGSHRLVPKVAFAPSAAALKQVKLLRTTPKIFHLSHSYFPPPLPPTGPHR